MLSSEGFTSRSSSANWKPADTSFTLTAGDRGKFIKSRCISKSDDCACSSAPNPERRSRGVQTRPHEHARVIGRQAEGAGLAARSSGPAVLPLCGGMPSFHVSAPFPSLFSPVPFGSVRASSLIVLPDSKKKMSTCQAAGKTRAHWALHTVFLHLHPGLLRENHRVVNRAGNAHTLASCDLGVWDSQRRSNLHPFPRVLVPVPAPLVFAAFPALARKALWASAWGVGEPGAGPLTHHPRLPASPVWSLDLDGFRDR